jgi:hypothetical protein
MRCARILGAHPSKCEDCGAARPSRPAPRGAAVNVSEVMVQYLAAAGTRRIFGYPGDPDIDPALYRAQF